MGSNLKICVTGGAGFIGQRLVERLEAGGAWLNILTRKAHGDTQKRRHFIADLTDGKCLLTGLLDGVDVVYHCAGEIKNPALMHALHVKGTARLLEAVRLQIAATQKPIHWVQLSSVGAYGPPLAAASEERQVTEATPTAPVGDYEVTKTLADEMVMRFAATESLFSYTILRPSNVVGAMMTNQSAKALVHMIKKRMFFYIGSGSAIATYIHVDDVVAALVLCGTAARARGEVFNLSNDCLLAEIVDAVSCAAGQSPPALCVPEGLLRLMVRLLSGMPGMPLTQERIDALVRRTRYPTQKIESLLGFTPGYAIPPTITAMFEK